MRLSRSRTSTELIELLIGLTVNGRSISLASGSDSFAAIDTGTTLVAGPQDAIEALYQQIPGSQALAQQQGYFSLRT